MNSVHRPSGNHSASRGTPVLYLILALPLLTSAFVGLPQLVRVGPVSGLGALTIVMATLAAAGVLLCRQYPRRLLARVSPYVGFLTWIGFSFTWARPDFWGVQNGILYLLFGSLILIAGVVSARHPLETQALVGRCILWIDRISLGIVFVSFILRGLPTQGGEWWIGPRGLALLGLIPLSWHAAGWYYRVSGSIVPACLWLIAIAMSLSRTAMAVSLVLVATTCVFLLRFRLRKAGWSIALFLLSLTVIGVLVSYNPAFHERFFAGDESIEVGSTRINAEGRPRIWAIVIASARQSPILGNGLGSSQAILRSAFPAPHAIDHPHNDYLRLWHDLGVVGLLLFMTATGGWLGVLVRSWYQAESHGRRSARVELAGALALLGVLLAMVTDNVIVYVFVMGPLGVLVGAGLGLHAQRGDSAIQRATMPRSDNLGSRMIPNPLQG